MGIANWVRSHFEVNVFFAGRLDFSRVVVALWLVHPGVTGVPPVSVGIWRNLGKQKAANLP